MSVDEIEKAITKLSTEDRRKLRAWWDDMEADAWDRQIEADAKSGKLDKLVAESEADFRAGRHREI